MVEVLPLLERIIWRATADGFRAIHLRVRGDGKRYKVRLLNQLFGDPPVYESAFWTSNGKWQEIVVPFSSLSSVRRGQILLHVPPFDPGQIAGLGFLISDKREGTFALEVDRISLIFEAGETMV